mmetsp:Transcript_81330/g.230444  ORF Transcript_81330/g.230444 Transcript_81330/m.230444 type:complete len:228 (-) Transcript_81330:1127-1810(-)
MAITNLPSSTTPLNTSYCVSSSESICARADAVIPCRRSAMSGCSPIRSPQPLSTVSMTRMLSGWRVRLHMFSWPRKSSSRCGTSDSRSAMISSRRLERWRSMCFLMWYSMPKSVTLSWIFTLSRIALATSMPMACTRGSSMSRISIRIASFSSRVSSRVLSLDITSGATCFSSRLMLRKPLATMFCTIGSSSVLKSPRPAPIKVSVATVWNSGFRSISSAGHSGISA